MAGVLAFSSVCALDVRAADADAQAMAETLTQGYGITSLQYALMDNGEIVESGVSGIYSKTENRLLTNENLYTIGSTSKMFVTAAMMQLVDEGKVDLDAPVTRYIPEFRMKDKRYRQITVRMLLNHSSGLMGSTYNNGFLFDDNDTQAYDTLLADLREQELKADPGAFSVYCNDGFTLAEMVIERVSGVSFTEYIHKHLCDPLGLTHTVTPQDDFDRSLVAKTYSTIDPMQQNGVDTANIIGTGGIYSTAEDLVRFAQVFMKGNTILSDASKQATMEKEYLKGQWLEDQPNGVAYGLGWDSVNLEPFANYGIKALTKGGDTLQMHSSLVVLPEYNMSAAVTSSGGNSAYDQMLAVKLLLNQLKEKGIVDELPTMSALTTPTQQTLDPELMKYTGYYADYSGLYSVEMTADGTMLYKNAYLEGNEQAMVFLYTGNGQFTDQTGMMTMSFLEQNGNTYMVYEENAQLPNLGTSHSRMYYAQKVEVNELEDSLTKAWEAREGKAYLIINNKYTSQSAAAAMPLASVSLKGDYLANAKVIDKNNAVPYLQIPMQMGRDLSAIHFYKENGVEYLAMSDYIAVDAETIKTITRDKFYVWIDEEGYNEWVYFGPEYAGKTMTITVPKDAGFFVYNNLGVVVNAYVNTKQNEFVLPQGGYILFAGNADQHFKVEIKDAE